MACKNNIPEMELIRFTETIVTKCNHCSFMSLNINYKITYEIIYIKFEIKIQLK